MAGISTGSAAGGKRAVDHEIPLVPFIDLLLCCIMFLLVTAVWNQLASIQASTPGEGPAGIDTPADARPLSVRVRADGYHVVGEAGDEVTIARAGEQYDIVGLREHLSSRREIAPNARTVVVSADDGVRYADVVLAMDTLVGSGFESVSVTDTL